MIYGWKYARQVIPGLFLLLFMGELSAQELSLDEYLGEKFITPNLEFIIDPSQELEISKLHNEVKNWQKPDSNYIRPGYIPSPIWVKLSLKNSNRRQIDFVLFENSHLTDFVTLYEPVQGGYRIYRTGDRYKFSSRKLEDDSFAFPLKLEGGESKTYYIRYQTTDRIVVDLWLYSPETFAKNRMQAMVIIFMYYSILLVMLLYNAFVLISVRNLSYLYYILYLFFLGITLMTLNGHTFQFFWPNFPEFNGALLPFLDFLAIGTAALFVRSFLESWKYSPRADRILLYVVYSTVPAMLACLSPIPYQRVLETLLMYLGVASLVILLVISYFALRVKTRASYYLLAAFSLLLLGVVAFSLNAVAVLPESFLGYYGVQIGSALEVVLLSFGLADRINTLQRMKERAENKYQYLFDSSREIIFTLDREFKLLTLNEAVGFQLGFASEKLLNKSFLELIHNERQGNAEFSRNVVREYLERLNSTGERVSFKVNLRRNFDQEPRLFTMGLELIKSRETTEILGRATPEEVDVLLDFFESESQEFYINNNLSNADTISHRLTRFLKRYLQAPDVQTLRIALREVLINAIEHGNLDLRFEEKRQILETGLYFEEIQKRQKDPVYNCKKVKIEYSLNSNRIAYRVTDEGIGFDHEKYMLEKKNQVARSDSPHGRGLLMTEQEFDVMSFNEKGNQVMLIKYFNGSTEDPASIF